MAESRSQSRTDFASTLQPASDFNVRLIADDTLLFMSSKEAHTLEYNVSLEIDKMQVWLQANKLSINIFLR